MDISQGLPAEVEILCQDRLLTQKLDCQNVPFRYNCYHEVGHLRRLCPWLMKGLVNCSKADDSPSPLAQGFSPSPPFMDAPQNAKDSMYSRSLLLFDDASINELLFI